MGRLAQDGPGGHAAMESWCIDVAVAPAGFGDGRRSVAPRDTAHFRDTAGSEMAVVVVNWSTLVPGLHGDAPTR